MQTLAVSETDRHETAPQVRVWDPLVRIGHWLIVAGVATAYFAGDEAPKLHVWAGYAVAAAVAVRIVWGFVGSRHARFSDFVRGPRAVQRYLAGLRSGRAPRFLGHNPAGGLMILALLASLAVTTVSGMALLAVEEGEGPLAGVVDAETISAERAAGHEESDAEETLEAIHSAFTYLTLGLVALHLGGVFVSSRAHKENLVRAMITGRKRADE